MEPWEDEAGNRQRSASGRSGWSWRRRPSTLRSGRRSARSPRRSAARRRPRASGCGRQRSTRGVEAGSRRRSVSVSRSWSERIASSEVPTRSCARRRLFRQGGAGPRARVMVDFIDEHRDAYGALPTRFRGDEVLANQSLHRAPDLLLHGLRRHARRVTCRRLRAQHEA